MRELVGTGVALVTPFNKDKSVDFEGLEKLVNFQIDNGVNYLVVLGTTGEPATLNSQEKEQVKQTVIKANKGRLPLVIGIGGNNTMNVVEEIKNTDLSAFCAILSVSPYYNKPTQEGIYQHFKAISEASPLPIIVYNVGVSLLAKRPGGYGETKLDIPTSKGVLFTAWFVFILCMHHYNTIR